MATVNNQKQIDFPQVRSKEASAKIKKETPSTATESFPGKAAPSGLSKENELEMLRQFDLCTEYGPCLGMPRLERWERAEKFGLNPPLMVYNIIKEHDGDTDYSECLWYNEKGIPQ